MVSSRDLESHLGEFFIKNGEVLEWGAAPSRRAPGAAMLERWVEQGRHAGLSFMEKTLEMRCDPGKLEEWVQGIVVFSFQQPVRFGRRGDYPRIAAYARGVDYHHAIRRMVTRLEAELMERFASKGLRVRGFVDTLPVFERDWAAETGLGWRAKNCTTLSRKHGSGFLLGGLLLNVSLTRGRPVQDFCGACTLCLEACPTDAFVGPGELDSNRCISYWTIESNGAVPAELSDNFGGQLFGCDVCQEVCPWNKKHLVSEPDAPDDFDLEPSEWLTLLGKGGGYQSRFRHSPLSRASRKMMLRNLCIFLRNQPDRRLITELEKLLMKEEDESLRDEVRRTLVALKKGG